ncbi:MAG: response regulator [Thermodesulfobacteriota bacterium]
MPQKILVVDDDILVLRALQDLLVAEGYEVATSTRGQEALEILEQEYFDLIILDVVMPKMTGFDVCRAIRAREDEKQNIKIIMLTAKTDSRDLDLGEESGCDLYITKPIDPGKLKQIIHGTLGVTSR